MTAAVPHRGPGLASLLSAIRPRLVLLTLLAIGPLVALMVAGGLENRHAIVTAAERQLENQARLYAEQQDDVIQEARNLLMVLARIPAVSTFQTGPCHALLRQVEADHPRVSVLTVARADGTIACSSRGETVPYDLRDRAYFQRAMADPHGAILSEVIYGKSTGLPTVIVALPMRTGVDAAPYGVLVASLNLRGFLQATHSQAGADEVVQVTNMHDGAILAHSHDVAAGSPADPSQLAALRAQPEGGVAHVRGQDGVDRILGHARLPGTPNAIVVSVALPQDAVVAAVNARLMRDLVGALVAALLAVATVWFIASRTLVVPLQELAGVAGRVGRGDLHSLSNPMPGAATELQHLAFAFDEMRRDLLARNSKVAAMRANLQRSEEHHRLLSENSTDIIARFDASFIRTYVSPACRELLGYEPDELIGRPADLVVHPDDRVHVRRDLLRPLWAGAASARVTYRSIHKDGHCMWMESGGRPSPDQDGFVVVTRNVSERKAMEEQLEAANRLLKLQALQDPLTGIANRRRFDEMLGHEFRRAQRLQEPVCILMLDIDHFKLFNDTHGHPAGDACLRTVANAIAGLLRRPGDRLGRYGGEEFAVVLPRTNKADALVLAERIRAGVQHLGLAHPSAPAGVLTVSIGVAAIRPSIGAEGPAAFVEAADAALYLAKKDGRNKVRLALQDGTSASLGVAHLA